MLTQKLDMKAYHNYYLIEKLRLFIITSRLSAANILHWSNFGSSSHSNLSTGKILLNIRALFMIHKSFNYGYSHQISMVT